MNWKTKALAIVGLAVIWVYGCEVRGQTHPDHHPTEGQLKQDYLDYNEKYFYGVLPTSLEIVIVRSIPGDLMGFTDIVGSRPTKIIISREYHPTIKQADQTLLHEQCHAYDVIQNIDEGLDSHGPNFQACMIRLAEHGAFKDLW